jgi:hypothetical protein
MLNLSILKKVMGILDLDQARHQISYLFNKGKLFSVLQDACVVLRASWNDGEFKIIPSLSWEIFGSRVRGIVQGALLRLTNIYP